MTITYPLDLPDPDGLQGLSVRPLVAAARGQSPFTYQEEIQMHQGQLWQYTLSLPPLKRVDAEPWITFFMQLNGPEGTFLMCPTDAKEPQGVGTGAPVVSGAGQSGRSLLTSGWTPSKANILKAGDYLSIGTGESTRLYKNLKDVASDGFGIAALDIWPRLREIPDDLAPITVNNPAGCFRLSVSELPHNIDSMLYYNGLSLPCREAL